MKKRQLTIFGIAAVLSLGVITATVATYVHVGNQQTIGISGSSAADGEYTLSLDKNEITNFGLTNKTATISYKLGMTPSGTYSQDTTIGNLAVSFSLGNNTNIDFIKDNLTISGEVSGYGTGINKINMNVAFNEETKLWEAAADVPFSNNGTQSVTFTLTINDQITVNDYISKLAETTINYNVSLSEQSENYEFYYLVGSFNNWTVSDKYRMAVNVMSSSNYEWYYVDKNAEQFLMKTGAEFKLRKGASVEAINALVPDTEPYNNSWISPQIKDTASLIYNEAGNLQATKDIDSVYFHATEGIFA